MASVFLFPHTLIYTVISDRFQSNWQQKINASQDNIQEEQVRGEDVTGIGFVPLTEVPRSSTTVALQNALIKDSGNIDNDELLQSQPVTASRLLRPIDLWRRNSLEGPEGWSHSFGSSSITSDHEASATATKLSDFRTPRQMTHQVLGLQNSASKRETKTSPIVSPKTKTSILFHLDEPASLQEAVSTLAIMARVPIKDRRYNLRMYEQCFIGSQLIDVFMEHEVANSRKDAVRVASNLNYKFGLFHHVVNNHKLKDEVRIYTIDVGSKCLQRRKLV